MSPFDTLQPDAVAVQIELSGLVQGVGLRPFVARLAGELGLSGFIRNNDQGVEIHVEGTASNIDRLIARLTKDPPPAARVDRIHRATTVQSFGPGFAIPESTTTRSIATRVPVDTAMCDSCRSEVLVEFDRRFRYPFNTCTGCGPRYSLIKAMPFDRVHTSMQPFAMCPKCEREYRSTEHDRFHAQTNSCPACGPQMLLTGDCSAVHPMQDRAEDEIRQAAEAIRRGAIIGLKGVGGYQLVCDATFSSAVRRLREKKGRPRKPFAVMVCSLKDAQKYANVGAAEAAVLTSAENPIVLLPGRGQLAAEIAPDLNQVGIMLPASTLHLLLLRDCGGPCVVTSANIDGEPLAWQQHAAETALQDVADAWLHHDRGIVRPIDDSVVRVMDQQSVTIRAGRGIAPMPIGVHTSAVLAVGGQTKVSLALSTGQQAVLGPHIGDMNSLASRERFVESVESLCQLYRVTPAVIAHDMHPDYFTSRWANEQNVQTVTVQHHHAHIVAGMLEHDWMDDTVLGIAFDGTGYGPDGTIWGGEFLLCTAESYQRVARLRPFSLVGGDRAVKEPWRVATVLLHDAEVNNYRGPTFRQKQTLPLQGHRKLFPQTSSMGRLIDGVASLLLGVTEVSYEGEAAMELEATCDENVEGYYELPIVRATVDELDWRPMIRCVVDEIADGIPVGTIAKRFLRGIAFAIAEVCRRFDDRPVVISGGCFQNAVLTRETMKVLRNHSSGVGAPGRIPPNDGGLAAGQLAVAAATLASSADSEGAV